MNSQPIGPDHQLPPPSPRKRRGVQILVWVLVLLVFAGAIVLVWNQHQDASQSAAPSRRGAGGPVAVTTVTAKKGDIGVYLDAIGTVTPVYTALITSQVNGQIASVNYREGQIVAKGASLVDIDDRPYRATLMQAQGTLQKDEGVLAQARMDLDRYRDAWARNAIPKQTLDDQEKIVQQDEGLVKQDQGTVQYDQVQVDFCHIKSPISGRVGLRLVDPGNVVQSSGTTTLAVVTQLQPITVIFTISEDSLGEIQPHLKGGSHLAVTAFDRSGQNKIAEGSLLSLDNQIDTTTGTVKARASFNNRDNALYPNQFVNTRLLVDTLHGVTLIPTSAIQHNGTAAFVYVIDGGTALMRPVNPGVSDGDTTQVTGVKPGEAIANSSFDKLQSGAKISDASKPAAPRSKGSSAP